MYLIKIYNKNNKFLISITEIKKLILGMIDIEIIHIKKFCKFKISNMKLDLIFQKLNNTKFVII